RGLARQPATHRLAAEEWSRSERAERRRPDAGRRRRRPRQAGRPSVTGPTPFRLAVPEAVLADLRERLARVRWPDSPPDGEMWQYGTDLGYLQQLVAYWRDGSRFDWRAQESLINAFPQYTAPVAGIDLHFIHQPGVGPDPLPLLLSHG